MPSDEWMEEEIRKIVPDSEIQVSDLHGTGIISISELSLTLSTVCCLLRVQRPILSHFMPYIQNGSVHALDLKCMTKKQAEASGDTVFDPHGEGEKQFLGVHIRRPKEGRS